MIHRACVQLASGPLQAALYGWRLRTLACAWGVWHANTRVWPSPGWLRACRAATLRACFQQWRCYCFACRRYQVLGSALAVVAGRGLERPRFSRYAQVVRRLRWAEALAVCAGRRRARVLHATMRAWVRFTFWHALLVRVLEGLAHKVWCGWGEGLLFEFQLSSFHDSLCLS